MMTKAALVGVVAMHTTNCTRIMPIGEASTATMSAVETISVVHL